jgi:hypothetical protein
MIAAEANTCPEAGFRFFLPAYLLADLDDALVHADVWESISGRSIARRAPSATPYSIMVVYDRLHPAPL